LFPQACDTIDNIDKDVYEQMAQAAASVLDVSYCTQIPILARTTNESHLPVKSSVHR